MQEINLVRERPECGRDRLPEPEELSASKLSRRSSRGNFFSPGIQKIPDIKKGDQVLVRLHTGTLSVNIPGIADEMGYLENRVRVMTQKTKKFLIGRLTSDGVVEVNL